MRLNRPASMIAVATIVAVGIPGTSTSSLSSVFNPRLDPTVRDYRDCATRLLNLKVSPEEADTACSQAFKPQDFAKCVVDISQGNPLPVTDAVYACRRVRRPVDLSSCFVDIRKTVKEPGAADVLGYCRRSLLPTRYANCVVGLTQGDKALTPPDALNKCIDAADLPEELDPTFIPFTQAPALQTEITPGPGITPVPSPQATPTPSPSPVPALY